MLLQIAEQFAILQIRVQATLNNCRGCYFLIISQFSGSYISIYLCQMIQNLLCIMQSIKTYRKFRNINYCLPIIFDFFFQSQLCIFLEQNNPRSVFFTSKNHVKKFYLLKFKNFSKCNCNSSHTSKYFSAKINTTFYTSIPKLLLCLLLCTYQ